MRFLKVLAAILAAVVCYVVPVTIGNLFLTGLVWGGIMLGWLLVSILVGVAFYRYLQRPAADAAAEGPEGVPGGDGSP